MKPLKSYFVLIQLVFLIYYAQLTRSQSPEDDCRSGYICLKKSMCKPSAMKQIIGSPKTCGKSKRGDQICCPLSTSQNAKNIQEPEFQEPCGLKGDDIPLNGTGLPNGRWPWMVSLLNERRRREQFLCTGFLIDKQHVVTAAHCVQGNHPENLKASIGSVGFRDGELYNIARILIPDGFKPRMFYDDIALLTLSREVESLDFNPVCLPTIQSVGVLEGLRGTLVGYRWEKKNYDLKLRENNGEQILTADECETAFTTLLSNFYRDLPKGINNQMLCTVELVNKKEDQCGYYYSGSPLMVERKGRWFAVGVSTFGFGMRDCRNAPSGYTRVTEYVDWIKKNIE